MFALRYNYVDKSFRMTSGKSKQNKGLSYNLILKMKTLGSLHFLEMCSFISETVLDTLNCPLISNWHTLNKWGNLALNDNESYQTKKAFAYRDTVFAICRFLKMPHQINIQR